MVYIHGGAWMIGEKREQGKPMMYELVARGWVCVAINYRLSPKATWPDHIVDAKRAVAWVKEHIDEYGGDPSFVAVSGGSAGGHLCALLALSAGDPAFQPGFEEADTSVQACVPFYGVMDLTSSPEGSAIFGPGLLKMLEKKVMKTTESEHPELFRAASPTYRVRAEAPPFFVLQGVNDTLVPVESARTFVERLRAVSAEPVAYAELPLAQHAFDILASLRCQATTSAVADFLRGRPGRPAGRHGPATPRRRPLRKGVGSGIVTSGQASSASTTSTESASPAETTSSSTPPASTMSPRAASTAASVVGRPGHREQGHPCPHGALVGRLLPADRTQHLGRHGQHRRVGTGVGPDVAGVGPGRQVHRALLPPAPDLLGHEGQERGEEAVQGGEGQRPASPGPSRSRPGRPRRRRGS